MVSLFAAMVPGLQAAHVLAPAAEKNPGRQGLQPVALLPLKRPALHEAHAALPEDALKVPGLQFVQVLDPGEEDMVPAGQEKQLLSPPMGA